MTRLDFLKISLFSIVMSFILFSYVTMRVDVSYVDGSSISYYGFPYTYIGTNLSSSLHYWIDYRYMAIDLLVYWFLIALFVYLKPVRHFLISKWRWSLAVISVLSVVPVVGICMSTYHHKPGPSLIDESRFENVISKSIHLGPFREDHP